MPWDPAQYERFVRERELPFADALALIGTLGTAPRIVDLGCGTGALTAKLAETFVDADVVGVDSSAEMLAHAKTRAHARLHFVEGDLTKLDQLSTLHNWTSTWDLIFSHAALHWVPDHATLIPRLFGRLAPGGRLVVQIPSNEDGAAHRALAATAAEAPFAAVLPDALGGRHVQDVRAYAEMLWRLGGKDIVAFDKIYPHELPDADAAYEWTKGTSLVPYFERLAQHAPQLRAAFEDRYRERLAEALPGSPIFFGFKRTLFAATAAR